MTHRSLNEIDMTVRKAAVGSGWPWGLAEDIGRAAAWLCEYGEDGAGAALVALREEPRPADMTMSDGAAAFASAQAAQAGPAALDLLAAGSGIDHVALQDLDSPLLLVGIAGVLTAEYRLTIELLAGVKRFALVGPEGLQLSMHVCKPGASIVAQRTTPNPPLASVPIVPALDINDEAWSAITALAARTYVPATDESRLRGAGAGLTDND